MYASERDMIVSTVLLRMHFECDRDKSLTVGYLDRVRFSIVGVSSDDTSRPFYDFEHAREKMS